MTYSQVDPSRLQGDALTRWYLRSPADIEQEQQAAAAQRYSDFFGASPTTPLANSADGGVPDAPLGNEDAGTVTDGARSESSSVYNPQGSAAWTPSGADGASTDLPSIVPVAANDWVCAGCHGTGISSPPPAFSKPPWVPQWTPGPNTAPRPPSLPHPPQCAMQNVNDPRICNREPGNAWKTICFASATRREAHCIANDGELGSPRLETHDGR